MSHSPAQIAAATERLDRFAELLSLDLPIPIIAIRMRITKSCAYGLLEVLREQFGRQAA